jgi:hypothetical protein
MRIINITLAIYLILEVNKIQGLPLKQVNIDQIAIELKVTISLYLHFTFSFLFFFRYPTSLFLFFLCLIYERDYRGCRGAKDQEPRWEESDLRGLC